MLADRDNRMQIDVDNCVLHGDVNITIQHTTSFGYANEYQHTSFHPPACSPVSPSCLDYSRRQKFGRIDFNTAMVPDNMVFVLKKSDIDDAENDKRVPADFQLILVFEPPYPGWQPRSDIVVQDTDEFWQKVFYQSAGQDGASCFWWNESLASSSITLLCTFLLLFCAYF
jgi:hypothetical protein